MDVHLTPTGMSALLTSLTIQWQQHWHCYRNCNEDVAILAGDRVMRCLEYAGPHSHVHFWQSYSRMCEHRQKRTVSNIQLKSSFEPNNNNWNTPLNMSVM